MPWWDEMAWILRHARHKEIHPFGTSESFLLDDENIEHSIRDILRLAKMRHLPLCQQTDDLAEVCGVARPYSPNGPLFLDWNQVREMRSAGMDIGSHTHSHPLLAHLALEAQEQELAESKAILESELRSTISAVAYPDGGKTFYNGDTTSIARQLGYRLGFSFIRHINRLPLADPLQIGRFAVSEDIDASGLRSMACFPALFA